MTDTAIMDVLNVRAEEFCSGNREHLVRRRILRLTEFMADARKSLANVDHRLATKRESNSIRTALNRRRTRLVQRVFQARAEIRNLKKELPDE